MSKKFILGVIGFIGVGMLFLAPTTHAAAQAPEVDLQTRTLLGQTLNVLQVVLNKIDARIADKANPIANPQEISVSLGGIKTALIAMDSYLKGASPIAAAPSVPAEANPSPAVNYAAAPSTPQTATVSWFVGPKILLIILPILVLAAVIFSFTRKKDPEEVKSEESAVIASEIKTT